MERCLVIIFLSYVYIYINDCSKTDNLLLKDNKKNLPP